MILALALLASTLILGPDMLDLSWVRPGGTERVWRELVPGQPPLATELIALAPDASAAALREKKAGGFLILPGELFLPQVRAAAFSPDSQKIAAAHLSGEIISTGLKGESPETLGRMRGVERLVWGKHVVAAGRSGAVLLPKRQLTTAPVRELVAAGDRIAVATASSLSLFDGSGGVLLRLRIKASSLALSPSGALAYAVGKEVWLIDLELKRRLLATETEPVRAVVFSGEEAAWVASGARRAGGQRLECASALAAGKSSLLATCDNRVVGWEGDAQRTLYTQGDCAASVGWALPLGDGFLVAVLIHDRRFSSPCEGSRAKESLLPRR